MKVYIMVKNSDPVVVENLQHILEHNDPGVRKIDSFDDVAFYSSVKYSFVGSQRTFFINGSDILHLTFDK